MKPEVLIMGASQSQSVMDQFEQHFHCHHLWQVAASEQQAFIHGVAKNVRAVASTAMHGISSALVDQLPRLEIVAVNGIGVDAVDFAATRARAILVTNTPGVLTDDVADLAVLLMLAAARRLPQLHQYVRDGLWEQRVPVAMTSSVRGKVVGIFGFGRIGQAIAARLEAFGVQLRYYQRSTVTGTKAERSASLMALAEESDFLIVCAPGGPETRHIINADVMAKLGPDGILVNIARGSLIDEAAMTSALQEGRLGAAALDVFANEPMVPPALRALNNVVLTPHVGSLTVETRHAMGQLVVDNLLAHFAGRPLLTPVA